MLEEEAWVSNDRQLVHHLMLDIASGRCFVACNILSMRAWRQRMDLTLMVSSDLLGVASNAVQIL